MRLLPAFLASACFGFAALTLAPAAWAGPVTVGPVSFSPEFQTSLEEELGTREGAALQRATTNSVSRALSRHGATLSEDAPVVVEIAIIDADPNHPTMQQLGDTPGLDPILSVYRGGAELHAVLRARDGAVLTEVTHRRYDFDLFEAERGATTWSSARRAISQFAEKVADAYDEHAS
jgi:hypothetical protein